MKQKSKINNKRRVFDVIYEWESLERQWTEKDRAWYVSYGTFFVVLIAAFAILQEYILILAIVAFIFLWFTQAAIPPETMTHQVTSLGIKTYGKLRRWSDINHFWFSIKGDFILLNLDILKGDLVSEGRMQRLSIIVSPEDQDEIFFTLIKFVNYGDQDEINFNILARILYGKYLPITTFLSDDIHEAEMENDIEDTDNKELEKVIG